MFCVLLSLFFFLLNFVVNIKIVLHNLDNCVLQRDEKKGSNFFCCCCREKPFNGRVNSVTCSLIYFEYFITKIFNVCLSLTTALGDETEKKKSIERESAKKNEKIGGHVADFEFFC